MVALAAGVILVGAASPPPAPAPSAPAPPASAPSPLPMDVWYSAIDDNGLPLNPVWEYSHEGKGLPDAGMLCDHFPNRSGMLYVQNCTTQRPTVDEARPFHGLIPNDRYFACEYLRNVPHDLRADSVHGHVNWTIATFDGLMSFDDYGFPPFADGDWDWLLQTGNKAGYFESNDPRGIIAEFDGAEVNHSFVSTWWSGLRDRVLDSRRHPAAARAAVHDAPAIVTGLFGLDTKHVEHAEVHPIYAMALRTAIVGNLETWEILARNWGDEGGCSNDQHNWQTTTVSFLFPDRNAGLPVITQIDITSTAPNLRWGEKMTSDGLLATFELAQPAAHTLDYGEIRLCYASCGTTTATTQSPGGYQMTRDDAIGVVRHRSLAPDEPRTLTRDLNH